MAQSKKAKQNQERDSKTLTSSPPTKDEPDHPLITDLTDHLDISKIMAAAGTGRRQSLQGFDDDYIDIVDYIVRSTHKIWEGRGMGLIYSHYRHNAKMHTADGLVYGREAWIAASIKALSAVPDRRLYADDVIWSGNDEDGFHTSHRMTTVGHNTGYSAYGPPTGKKVVYRVIANCFVKENRVCEEWVVRDEMSVVQQLGFDPHQLAQELVRHKIPAGVQTESYGEVKRLRGQDGPELFQPKSTGGFDIEDFIRQTSHEIWNWRLFNRIYDYFIENYRCYTCPNREIYGLGDYLAHILSWFVAFPDGKMMIDHIYWLGNDEDGYRVASRWSFVGTHDGVGKYGPPTGKRVWVMGISHFWVKDGKFLEEWTIFDEMALLKQLY